MAFLSCVHTAWRLRTPPADYPGVGHGVAKHQVEFITCHRGSEDDMLQAKLFWTLYGDKDCKIHWIIGNDRDCASVGGKWNKILQSEITKEFDVITFLGDKTIPITRDWDNILGDNAEANPNKIMWWYYVNTLVGQVCCCIPIIPMSWVKACNGPIAPDIFPFWQVDGWIEEVSVLSQGCQIVLPIEAAGLRGRTKGCRDILFWNKVYAAMAGERIKQADTIMENLGITRDDSYDQYKQLIIDRCRIAPHMVGMVNDDIIVDPDPPTDGYLMLKKEAEEKYGESLAKMDAKVEEIDRLRMEQHGIDISNPETVRQPI